KKKKNKTKKKNKQNKTVWETLWTCCDLPLFRNHALQRKLPSTKPSSASSTPSDSPPGTCSS
ncbi:hypothetical protein, partial [Escherichia coli]|uniref:hypothetical protein n=1 Tax=Escherichia coli TaxID=562 RepID=UPI00207B224C